MIEYCYRCGLEATYFVPRKKQWACDAKAQKCPAVKAKIGAANKVALTGRKATDSHRANISASGIGRKPTEDTKLKISISNIEHWKENPRDPWNKGKKGSQVAWNKGLKKQESLEIISRNDPVYSHFRKYRNRVAVRTRKTYIEFKHEINPMNLPLGKCGIDGAHQVDHIITVRQGFEQGIDIEIISAKDNLQILPWLENVKKYDGKGLRK